MAQIGCYVPAKSMSLGMLDGILIRMGGEWGMCSVVVATLMRCVWGCV